MSSESGKPRAAQGGSRAQRIQAVDRAVQLLRAVAAADTAPTAAELAQQSGVNRSTAWRLLATLEDHGLVERDSGQGYSIGYGAVALAQCRSGSAALVRVARPALDRLAEDTQETVNVSVATRDAVVAIDQRDPQDALLRLDYLTRPLPLHCTSNGKIVLSSMPGDQVDAILAGPLEAVTPKTVVNPERLRAIVERVRREGYATNEGELDLGVNGVSVGVHGDQRKLVAILSVSAPAHRLPSERLRQVVPQLERAAADIERRLGDTR